MLASGEIFFENPARGENEKWWRAILERSISMETARIGINNFRGFLFFIHLIYETNRTRQGEFVNGFILKGLNGRTVKKLNQERFRWSVKL